jgi:DNA polymerase-3 subunit gamma/tau
LLVSKDAATTQLLETSDAIRKHYAEQAARCEAAWIFKALDIVNTCDINYRTARNKRLTVELCLVKLAQLTLVAPAAVPQPQPAPKQQPAPKPQSAPQPKRAPQPVPQPAAIPKIPKIPTMPSIPSLNQTANPSAKIGEGSEEQTNTSVKPAEENRPFTRDQFFDAWAGIKKFFVNEPRLMALLNTHQPELVDEEHCVLTLPNEWSKGSFKQAGKQAMDYVREQLHNRKLQLTLKVAEYDTSGRAYTPEEKYKVLVAQNAELANMKTALGLQIE